MSLSRELPENPLLLNSGQTLKVIEIFLRDEMRRVGFEKAVLGLSGGIDSALSAYLAVRALGKENVHCVMMPYKTSNPSSLADAQTVVKHLGVSSEIIDITPMADAYFAMNKEMDSLQKGNVFARLRMIVLYDKSHSRKALVIGTSNKTEWLLGYTTLFGDSASAINPIGDLYKTQVRQLSKEIGVPDAILNKAPSADLWSGQTDEAEMGLTYDEVDLLLYYMIDCRQSNEELMARGFQEDFITKVRGMIRRSQFKRMPPLVAKISSRTVNIDFRYPRDWGS
ncbi:MAG: NAD+ synthase [Bacteroidota bacterium]|nr:NAD+ synthase [Bacteroidota bacterium]MDP4230962.1 NAD+ synthase [Bacteroidota bacterium]MDP4235167.1 NAD+ synthase [Bacteroidota bacterium]